jgi:hypothetical protein
MTGSGGRTLHEANRLFHKTKWTENLGYIKKPLTGIDFKYCCADMLHLWLRVTDKLEVHLLKRVLNLGLNIILHSNRFFYC